MGTVSKIIGVVYLLIALYMVNAAFDFIVLPAGVSAVEMLIFLIAAVVIGIAAVKSLLKKPQQSGLLG